jgi:hypothetical protein
MWGAHKIVIAKGTARALAFKNSDGSEQSSLVDSKQVAEMEKCKNKYTAQIQFQ